MPSLKKPLQYHDPRFPTRSPIVTSVPSPSCFFSEAPLLSEEHAATDAPKLSGDEHMTATANAVDSTYAPKLSGDEHVTAAADTSKLSVTNTVDTTYAPKLTVVVEPPQLPVAHLGTTTYAPKLPVAHSEATVGASMEAADAQKPSEEQINTSGYAYAPNLPVAHTGYPLQLPAAHTGATPDAPMLSEEHTVAAAYTPKLPLVAPLGVAPDASMMPAEHMGATAIAPPVAHTGSIADAQQVLQEHLGPTALVPPLPSAEEAEKPKKKRFGWKLLENGIPVSTAVATGPLAGPVAGTGWKKDLPAARKSAGATASIAIQVDAKPEAKRAKRTKKAGRPPSAVPHATANLGGAYGIGSAPVAPSLEASSTLAGGVPANSTCKCSKTMCLKLYCVCFQGGRVCLSKCRCVNCKNTVAESGSDGERTKAIMAAIERKPDAFKKKDRATKKMSAGCSCKRSKCLKKYCACFSASKSCTDKCVCAGCENGKGSAPSSAELAAASTSALPSVAPSSAAPTSVASASAAPSVASENGVHQI